MSRLTKAVKQQIIENWVKSKWQTKLNKSNESYIAVIRWQAEKDLSEKIEIYNNNKHIKEYLIVKTQVRAQYISGRIKKCKYIQSKSEYISTASYVSNDKYCCATVNMKSSNIVKALNKHNNLITKFNDELDSINNVLLSTTTIKKLCDILPEIEKYVPKTSNCTSLVSTSCLVKAKSVL